MTIGAIKPLNKGILLGFSRLDNFSSMPFSSHQLVKTAERSSLPLPRRIAFGEPPFPLTAPALELYAPLADSNQPRWLALPDWTQQSRFRL